MLGPRVGALCILARGAPTQVDSDCEPLDAQWWTRPKQ